MLFKPFLIDAMKAGIKTETRRLKLHVKPGKIYCVDRRLYQKEHEGWIRVESIHVEKLSQITQEAVVREGFPDGNIETFIKGFKQINEKNLASLPEDQKEDPTIHVIKFTYSTNRAVLSDNKCLRTK